MTVLVDIALSSSWTAAAGEEAGQDCTRDALATVLLKQILGDPL